MPGVLAWVLHEGLMPKLKLTKTNIDRVAKPGAGTVLHFDTETKGFGLRVTARATVSKRCHSVVDARRGRP